MLFFKIFILIGLLSLVKCYEQQKKDVISIDYYGGKKFLRHTHVVLDCKSDLHRMYCEYKCSKSLSVCVNGNCYCDKKKTEGLLPSAELMMNDKDDSSSEESIEVGITLDAFPLTIKSEPEKFSIARQRRHHIAHFCPDLEKARECIRKCIKKGKPAFCGKDHVCYCGHKSMKNLDEDDEKDMQSVYSEFKDLYAKYFGLYNDTGKSGTDTSAANSTENNNDHDEGIIFEAGKK